MTNYVSLSRAVLCAECNGISDASGMCPKCGSAALMSLARVLNREPEPSGVLERMTLREFQELGSTGVTLDELDKALVGREN